MNALTLSCCAALLAAGGSAAPVDFDTEVLPVLTKAGCNAAACHGAAAGRGGFKLSLFGGDPAADYDAITRELEGRRINHAQPDEALLILKPTEQLDHEGGMRFEFDSPQALLLARWIGQGAVRAQTRNLVELQVRPALLNVAELPSTRALTVTAHYDDGTTRDVTSQAVYAPADPAAVTADDEGKLMFKRRGQHTVVVRFLSQVETVQATVPLRDQPVDLSDAPRRNWIDDEINDSLKALHLGPSPQADEATLLRRLTLDLTGRLPTPQQQRDYLADRDGDKYRNRVDRLLASPEFVEYWTHKFATLLRVRAQPKDRQGARAFHNWIARKIADGAGLDSIAVALLNASGDTHQNGPANFYLVAGDARGQAEYMSEALMGVRLRCANCHNHPLDRWTQDDYHGLAAVFAKIQRGKVVRLGARGEVTHPRTGDAAVPRIPGDRFLSAKGDGRDALAKWLVDPQNPYFARAHVNRLWKSLMGRGLVEPTDDLRSTNPATHPRLLDRLAADFAEHGCDIRHSLRTIANSAAYMRSSVASDDNQADDCFYSRWLARPLAPEVMADALADVTGVAEKYGDEPLGARAISLFDPAEPSPALDILGRCSRQDSCESADQSSGGLTTTLHLINGDLVNRRLTDRGGRLRKHVQAGASIENIVDDFYRRALARPPNQDEQAFWRERLTDSGSAQRREKLEDFVWSLVSSQEFRTNH